MTMFNKIYKILFLLPPIVYNIFLLIICIFILNAEQIDVISSLPLIIFAVYLLAFFASRSDKLINVTKIDSKYSIYGYKVSRNNKIICLYKQYIFMWVKIDSLECDRNEVFDISTAVEYIEYKISILNFISEEKLKIKKNNALLSEELKTWKRKN